MSVRGTPNATVTFLFTDIEGSTRQWEESPEMHGRVERHFAALRDSISDAGGSVFSSMGDGVAAAFHSADAAVRAAIHAQHHISDSGLRVRMGLHTGEAEQVGNDFRGRPVNRAARVMAIGHGGQILLSDVTASLIRGGGNPVELIDLGPHRLRDLSEAERVWQVIDPDLDRDFPPLRSLDSFSNNLPAQRSSLVGRENEIARVCRLIADHRIVTLTGVGGVGKTRLALQVAADVLSHFSNVWFIGLASVSDADDVGDTVALTIGAGPAINPTMTAVTLIGRDRVLLVIDNCEHVVDAATALIDTLTAACPNLSVLSTSREALGIDGEHIVAVRSLDPSTTALELFEQRASAAGANLDAMDRASIEYICRRLDGIPLAVELAAARVSTLGLTAVMEALDDRFSLLSGGRRRALDRHGTMRATIDWSHRLLEPNERRLFQWLAIFPNGFELDAARFMAEALGLDEHATTEYVDSLVHKSMIATDDAVPALRYRMLETMRAFALEQLDDGERLAATTAQAEWVASLADLPVDSPCSAAVERNTIRLEREVDSWRDAATFAVRTRSPGLAGRLCGPPVAYMLLGRHDLVDFVLPLLDLCDAPAAHDGQHLESTRRRRSVLVALLVSSAGSSDADILQRWADEVFTLEDIDLTGVGTLMQWLTLAWRGEFETSVKLCLQASVNPRLAPTTRDMCLGIATLDRFSLTDVTSDADALIERALATARRSEVAIHRVTCLLGAAWGLSATDPNQALALVRQARSEIPLLPALTRLTLPGSASRLLARLDPRIAAAGLLELLDAAPVRRSFVDLIPTFYATALLHRVRHPAAHTALASLTVTPAAPYLSMMDFLGLARQAAETTSIVSLSELESMVRAALGDIVETAAIEAVD